MNTEAFTPSIDWSNELLTSTLWVMQMFVITVLCLLVVLVLLERTTEWGRQFWRITGDYFRGRQSVPVWAMVGLLLLSAILFVRINVLLSYYSNDLLTSLQLTFQGGDVLSGGDDRGVARDDKRAVDLGDFLDAFADLGIGEGAGARAPDATGLTRDAVTGPLRLFSLLGRREHTTLLYAPDGPVDVATFERAAEAAIGAAHGRMDVYLIAAPGADVAATELPVIRDTAGDFARAYASVGPSAYVVRPDGYLGLAAAGVDPAQLAAHLGATFARPEGDVTG